MVLSKNAFKITQSDNVGIENDQVLQLRYSILQYPIFRKVHVGLEQEYWLPPKKWGWWGPRAWWLLTKAKAIFVRSLIMFTQKILVKAVCFMVSTVSTSLEIEPNLVGGLEHEWIMFPFTWEFQKIPTDFHSMIFQRGSLNHQPGDYSASLAIY